MLGLCKIILLIFALAWLAAVVFLLIGTFGWFGQEKDPLSGIFLVPLGLPWNLFVDGLSESLRPWAAVLAPGVNLILIRRFSRYLTRPR